MNYKFVYESIIQKAKSRVDVNKYYEKHHILPKSLGGSNDEKNLVKLTAREHFICHWLLVKMYEKGTCERRKMLFAFWRMKSNPNNNGNRYINSRAYEYFRNEFTKSVSSLTKQTQIGKLNSQFGKKWFTNYVTGESRSLFEKPNDKWIEGRNLFNGQYCSLKKKMNNILETETKKLWNEYHSGNYKSLREFEKTISISIVALRNRFVKFIPLFLKCRYKGKEFPSNKSFIELYS